MKTLYITSIIITIVCILSFIIGIFYVQQREIIITLFICMSPLLIVFDFIIFAKYSNKYPLNIISEYEYFSIGKKQLKSDITIEFKKVNKLWICNSQGNNVILDLSGYFFQKSYIVAYVIRQIRYPLIYKKLPLSKLFKLRLKISKYDNVNISIKFQNKNHIYYKKIVIGGISRIGILCQMINQSKYYLNYLFMKTTVNLRKDIAKINERKFKNGKYL